MRFAGKGKECKRHEKHNAMVYCKLMMMYKYHSCAAKSAFAFAV